MALIWSKNKEKEDSTSLLNALYYQLALQHKETNTEAKKIYEEMTEKVPYIKPPKKTVFETLKELKERLF